jgi:hypothetical protein
MKFLSSCTIGDFSGRAQLHESVILSAVGLSPLGTAANTGLLYQPQMTDDGGMKTGGESRTTRRKPISAPLCPPQTPHAQNRARTRAAVVGSQRLIS